MTAPILHTFGSDLTPEDYHQLEQRWITPEIADAAGLRRADNFTGREISGRKKGNQSGIIIPNIKPDEPHPREFRLKLDYPEMETGSDGTLRSRCKYLQPPGRPNLIYFPPGTTLAILRDTSVPLLIVEGELKGLAAWRASNHNSASPRFAVAAVAGVWNFIGTVGKTTGPNGERVDVKGILPDIDLVALKGRRVIFGYDADVAHNPKVQAARWKFTAAVVDRGAVAGNLEWPLSEGKGIDDRLAKVGPDRVLAAIDAVTFGDWQSQLLRNKESGKLLACYENAALMLERHPELAGIVGYDEFSGGVYVMRQPPAPITAQIGDEIEDRLDTELIRWLERHGLFVKPAVVRSVVDTTARRNPYHPVRNYLESLAEWDGQQRVDTWLTGYCGAADSAYTRAVGACWLRSGVARVMQPGCKSDHVLVLEGPQGIGKSTTARILGGDWFTDQLGDIGSKDASMQLRGAWIIELSELGTLGRADSAKEKAFLTQQEDRFRLPYGRRIIHAPRQCIFVATTNADSWLKDETGGRRFWPVRCGRIDLQRLRQDRDQLWAEALHQYRAGTVWHLGDQNVVKDAMAEQKHRYESDVWQPVIETWIEQPTQRYDEHGHPVGTFTSTVQSVTIDDVLAHAIGKRLDQWNQADKNRVARCLVSLQWERFRERKDGKLTWRYRKVAEQ